VYNYIANPVICMQRGSAMLFENLDALTYPVYDKDSLLNTNEAFDYGEFLKLPELLADGTYTRFVWTFEDPGIYVFSDSSNPAKQIVISVMQDKMLCPANSEFSPMTYMSLLRVDAAMAEVLHPPDWVFFFGVLGSFMLLIFMSICTVGYIYKKNWHKVSNIKAEYQRKNYKNLERNEPKDKKAIVSLNTESSSF